MTHEEMELMTAGIGELFREYLASLSADEKWDAGYDSDRGRAQHVFEGLLAWLEKDYNG